MTTPKGQWLNGVVVAVRPGKTVVVKVDHRVKHPRYGKYYSRHKRYQVHDEMGVALGDRVEIRSHRPISRHKFFVIANKI